MVCYSNLETSNITKRLRIGGCTLCPLIINKKKDMDRLFQCKHWIDPGVIYGTTWQHKVLIDKLFVCTVKKLESSYYKDLASESDYPLHDVLWDANRCFDNVKVSMKRRQVVLLTCRDNPCSGDAAEQNRIRLRAKTFSDINVHLRIVGLGDSWNHEIFYKDIEMLANNMNIEDVKRMHLADLEKQVRFTAKPKSHIKWNIGKEVELPIILTSFSR